MKKIVCLFPGIGYTCDKPLLYYSGKMLKGMGWEVMPVQYFGFPSGIKGNRVKMQQAADMALEQAEMILRDINWKKYDQVLFIGKSVGTVVCTAYADQHRICCRQVLFTPVEATFQFVSRNAIVFHGTADPWADTKIVEAACMAKNIPIYEMKNANHSLETGDIDYDIDNIRNTMRIVKEYLENDEDK